MVEKLIYQDKLQFFDYHGIVPFVNVESIQLGLSYKLEPIYGNNAIFSNNHFKKTGEFLLGPLYECQNETDKKKDVTPNNDEITTKETKYYKQFWEDVLYFCEFCFKYTNDEIKFTEHCKICPYQHNQPGKLVYLGNDYLIKKVSPYRHDVFLESLCLFTKFFLDNKSSFCNLKEFDFFIVYARELDGISNLRNKPLGFFSKQIASTHFENLSSILIVPPYRNRGLGTLLIEFSYHLSIHQLESSSKMHNSPNIECFTTGPESPLSPFGLIMYVNYWQKILVIEMLNYKQNNKLDIPLIKYLMEKTHFESEHIILTLKYMKCIKIDTKFNKKYIDWKVISKIYKEKHLKDYKPTIDKKDLLIYF